MRRVELNNINEAEGKTASFAFGRMNPPTIGHKKLADTVIAQAGDPYIFLSQSQKPQTDPLDFTTKVALARQFFPGISVGDPSVKTIIQALTKLDSLGYDNVIYVAGSDRIQDFTELLNKYNGTPDKSGNIAYTFKDIQVVSAGERDPDAEGAEGMSASKMRAAAAEGDFEAFKSGTPEPKLAQTMYDRVRAGMGITEEAPPGREKQVKKLKSKFGKEGAYAIAWAQHNKHGKPSESVDLDDRVLKIIETLQDLHRAKPLDEATTQYVLKQVATIREHSLNEKRRFPDKNQKESLLSSLLKYEGQNVFISFQRVKKLGINPRFNFDGSPLGVYSYFLPAVLDDFKKLGSVQKGVDFGSERPYVFIFKVNDLSNVIDVEAYSNTNLKKDLKKLNLIIQDTHEDANKFFAGLQKKKRTKYPFEILMTAIAEIAEYESSYMRKLFVQLGYYGIMDNVGSTTTTRYYAIKESIFFSTEHIKVIDMFINHNPADDDIAYKDGKPVDIDPFADTEIDYSNYLQTDLGPTKKVKLHNSGPLEIIEPGLTPFKVGDKISQEEYDEYKEHGLEIKNDSKIKEHLNNIKEASGIDFETFQKQYATLNKTLDQASANIRSMSKDAKGPMGLVNPEVKNSPEFKKAQLDYNKASNATKAFLKGIPKEFLKRNSTRYRNKDTNEATLDLPDLETGDELMVGKFKNRKATIKDFKKDDHGQPVAVTNKGDQKIFKGRVKKLMPTEDALNEKCWDGYKQVGMKKKGKRKVPNCVPESDTTEGKSPHKKGTKKYNKHMAAMHASAEPKGTMIEGISYADPQFDVEWEEANRYPYLEKLGSEGWEELAKTGRAVRVTTDSVKKIGNTGADGSESLDDLEPEKVARLKQAMDSGTVEMPIVVKQPDGSLELIAGNTRLIGLISTQGEAQVWLVDASTLTEGVGRIVKGVNTTPDVGVNQTKIEAAKLNIKVDKDGRPPVLERGSIGVPLSSGLTVNVAPHRELKIKKSTKGRLNYENPRTNRQPKSKRGATV